MRHTRARIGGLLLLAGLLAAGGCGGETPDQKFGKPIEGIAQDIDPESGKVSMRFKPAESTFEVVRSGFIDDKTTVEINGRTARIDEVRPGERVRVTGYQTGSGEDKRYIVTHISVSRPEDWHEVGVAEAAATGPATQPAP